MTKSNIFSSTITALVKCVIFNYVSVLKIDRYFNVNVNVTIKGSGDPKNIIETWVRSQQRKPEIIQMCCMSNWKRVSHLSCVFLSSLQLNETLSSKGISVLHFKLLTSSTHTQKRRLVSLSVIL